MVCGIGLLTITEAKNIPENYRGQQKYPCLTGLNVTSKQDRFQPVSKIIIESELCSAHHYLQTLA